MLEVATTLAAGPIARALATADRARSVPAYARAFELAGVGSISAETWAQLPLLTKEDMISGVSAADPYGERLGVERDAVSWVFVAPGPIYMPFTSDDVDAIAGRFADTFARGGITSSDVVDQTTLYNWVVAATLLGKGIEALGATAVPGGAGDTQRHIDVIEDLGVTAILAFPTFLVHLLDTAAEQGRKLPLKRAVVMGELHDPREKVRLREQYGISVREYYGTADVGPVAVECPSGTGMHLRDDILVEFVDPQTGNPVSAVSPTQPAEMVVTDPDRQAMPIIRLRTGDLVDSVETAPCSCGLTTPRIGRIVGRVGDITKVKGMFVVPGSVKTVFLRHEMTARYQLVVSRDSGRDRLTLRVEGSSPANWETVLADVSQALRVQCESEFVATLPDDRVLVDDRAV